MYSIIAYASLRKNAFLWACSAKEENSKMFKRPKIKKIVLETDFKLTLDQLKERLDPRMANIREGHFPLCDEALSYRLGILAKKSSRVEFTFVHFGHCIDDETATRQIYEIGFRPASLYELFVLSLGKWKHSVVDFSPIVALSAVCVTEFKEKYIHYLDLWDDKRIIRNSKDSHWHEYCRFLVFPQVPII